MNKASVDHMHPTKPSSSPKSTNGLLSRAFRPREKITFTEKNVLSVAGVVVFFAVWITVSATGLVPAFFLPAPIDVATKLFRIIAEDGFLFDIWASTARIMGGFFLAAALAIPIGVVMGNFPFFRAFLEPLFGAARYLPASAFIPLLIIWLGIGEDQKWAVIFIGVFFPLTLMIADTAATVSKDLVNSAYTLGAKSRQVFAKILIPACLPAVVDNLRITMGIAWTYVIVAELVGAERGIGIAILQAQRFLQTDQVIAGIVTVGIMGVITDIAFRVLHRKLFAYLY